MKIVIIGPGQLGSELIKAFSGYEVLTITHEQCDIQNGPKLLDILESCKPDGVINCAAYHNLDNCEKEPHLAFNINAIGAYNVAHACKTLHAFCAYISTAYVFGGGKVVPYHEDDIPDPQSMYAISKLAGEFLTKRTLSRYYIFRTNALFGSGGSKQKRGNFVSTMLAKAHNSEQIHVVNDQFISPSYTKDVAFLIKEIILRHAYGLYHIVNSGICTWYEFAKTIFEYSHLSPSLSFMLTENTDIKRPVYSVLESKKLHYLDMSPLRYWKDALREFLISNSH